MVPADEFNLDEKSASFKRKMEASAIGERKCAGGWRVIELENEARCLLADDLPRPDPAFAMSCGRLLGDGARERVERSIKGETLAEDRAGIGNEREAGIVIADAAGEALRRGRATNVSALGLERHEAGPRIRGDHEFEITARKRDERAAVPRHGKACHGSGSSIVPVRKWQLSPPISTRSSWSVQ